MIRVRVRPDTDRWMQERRKSVGASEAGGLIRESHFGKTPLSIYLDKIGAGRDSFDPIKSLVTHEAEPMMQKVFEAKHGTLGTVRRGFMARPKGEPWLHATFDRILERPDGSLVPLQFKTASPFSRQDWDNGPLPDYLAQEDVECRVLDNAPFAYLFVWFWGSEPNDFELFTVYARPERQDEISRRAKLLMECVKSRTPPPPTLGDDLAALYPAVGGRVVRADADTLDAVALLRATAKDRREFVKEATAVENDAKHAIEAFMQDATELVNPYTNELIHTWREDKNGNRRHFSPKTKDFPE